MITTGGARARKGKRSRARRKSEVEILMLHREAIIGVNEFGKEEKEGKGEGRKKWMGEEKKRGRGRGYEEQ